MSGEVTIGDLNMAGQKATGEKVCSITRLLNVRLN